MQSIPTRVPARKTGSRREPVIPVRRWRNNSKSDIDGIRQANARAIQAIDIITGREPLLLVENGSLYFNVVGQFVYRAIVADRRVYHPANPEIELDGLAIQSRRLIVISPVVEPAQREEVLYHELYHAWSFHIPRARGEEERAQLYAAIIRQLRIDMECNGGLEKLWTMKPTPVSLPAPRIARAERAAMKGGAA